MHTVEKLTLCVYGTINQSLILFKILSDWSVTIIQSMLVYYLFILNFGCLSIKYNSYK